MTLTVSPKPPSSFFLATLAAFLRLGRSVTARSSPVGRDHMGFAAGKPAGARGYNRRKGLRQGARALSERGRLARQRLDDHEGLGERIFVGDRDVEDGLVPGGGQLLQPLARRRR